MDEFLVIDKGAVVPGKPWAVLHTPTNRIAPADPACPWLDWADGRTTLAYFATRNAAERWISDLPSATAPRSPDGRGAALKAGVAGSNPAGGTS